MAGRKRKPDHLLAKPRPGSLPRKRKEYKTRAVEQRGITYKEPLIIKSFWKDYKIDQIQSMSDDEILQAIDKFLEAFIYRQKKVNKLWDFPIKPEYLSIAPYQKK